MAQRRPFQQNAADPKQGASAGRRARDQRARELNDLAEILSSEPGRRVIWRLIGFCGIHQTMLTRDPLEMAAAAGRQNVGHFLMAEVAAADDEAMFVMMREARAAVQRENRETDATVKTADTADVSEDKPHE